MKEFNISVWDAKLNKSVREYLPNDTTGHGIYHAIRVKHIAVHIAQLEGADIDIVTACSYLHDIAHENDCKNHSEVSAKIAIEILKNIDFPSYKINQVENCIKSHRWTLLQNLNEKESSALLCKLGKDFMVFVDADRLDAMGSIGIARTFAFGGNIGRPLWIPEGEFVKHDISYGPSSFDHFNNKLLKLRDKMYTNTGRIIAEKRHKFMEQFLSEFKKELTGEIDYE